MSRKDHRCRDIETDHCGVVEGQSPSGCTCRNATRDRDSQSTISLTATVNNSTRTRQLITLTISSTVSMPAEQASVEVRRKAAREVIDILHEIATLLVCSQRSRT